MGTQTFVVYFDGKLDATICINGKRNGFFSHSNRIRSFKKELDLIVKYLNLIRDYYIIHNNKIHATISSIVNINPKDKIIFINKQKSYINKELLKTLRKLNKNKILFDIDSIVHENNNCMKKFNIFFNKSFDKLIKLK